jgi:membrane fusion protein (multidrug efflux system)
MADAPNEETQSPKTNKGQRRRALIVLALVVLAVGVAFAIYWLLVARYAEYTDDAYVAGNLVQVTSQVPGIVVSIAVEETDRVTQGSELVHLADADAKVELARAEAELGRSVREVHKMFISTDQYKAGVVLGEIGLKRAEADLHRRDGMDKAGALSAEDLQHAREMVTGSIAGLELARAQLESSRALVSNTTVERHPQVLAAAAQVRAAYLNLRRTAIPTPVSGYVAKRNVQVGQRVNPGQPLLAIVPVQGLWVDANFKEVQLRHLRIGQPVTVVADIYGGDVKYRGRVAGLGLGTGAAFSLLPAQNATGNWIKVVQRVPVRIEIDADQLREHPLRLGLSMHVTVDTHDRGGLVLAQSARTQPASTTPVYDRELHEADALIAGIVRANLGAAAHPAKSNNSNKHSAKTGGKRHAPAARAGAAKP